MIFISILILVGIYIACSEETVSTPENPDLVFSRSVQIKIPEYSYIGVNQEDFIVNGDTVFVTGIPDTLDSTPLFFWNDTLNSATITVAVFTSQIQTDHNSILNTDDIVWQWHSGTMMEGEIGKVAYLEGKTVKNDSILYEMQPLPLESGLYYWAIWAWTKSGTKIVQSSRPLSFYVK